MRDTADRGRLRVLNGERRGRGGVLGVLECGAVVCAAGARALW